MARDVIITIRKQRLLDKQVLVISRYIALPVPDGLRNNDAISIQSLASTVVTGNTVVSTIRPAYDRRLADHTAG